MRATVEPLSKLIKMGLPRNAKDHDLGEIHESFRRFGYLERVIVNEETGHVIAGHGRIEGLERDRQSGLEPPEGIEKGGKSGDGSYEWLVPSDWVRVAEGEEEAAAIALNRLVESGGWNEALLVEVLGDLAVKGEEMLR